MTFMFLTSLNAAVIPVSEFVFILLVVLELAGEDGVRSPLGPKHLE